MKKKIFGLLIILTMFFGFAFTSLEAKAEYIEDNKFVINNTDFTINVEDVEDFLLFLFNYAEQLDLFVEQEQDVFYADIGNNLYGGLYFDFQADLPSLDYTFIMVNNFSTNLIGVEMKDYNEDIIFTLAWFKHSNEFAIIEIASYNFNVVITLFEIIEEPPFSSFINFIKNLLQDLLKSITDMTISLINNIWDTNLIDINLVILSDTSIYSGTLNDMLYSIFSIFYVIFAITLVWRLLTKIIKKFTFWDRW